MRLKDTRIITAILAVIILILSLASCGSGGEKEIKRKPTKRNDTFSDNDNSNTIETDYTDNEAKVKITKTAAKTVGFEKYETDDFSVTIPKGWTVTSGGTNIYHSIRIYDPDEPINQMFLLLKADILLHSQEGKNAWQQNYNMGNTQAGFFANAPVLENPSTEGFYQIFSQYTDFVSEVEPSYSGYDFPIFDSFSVTDRFDSTSGLRSYAMGDELLRATFTDGAKEGEGLFAASVVDFGSYPVSTGEVVNYQLKTVDGGYYMAYNIVAVTAVKDSFIEWERVLTDCMKTLQYSESFINATNQASNETVALAMQISQNFNQTMDGFMSSWESRNKSQDIISQKQSDATLGYERVYDTETEEIYRAAEGFTDIYDGKRYQRVTDDNMYTQPISGYIEKE